MSLIPSSWHDPRATGNRYKMLSVRFVAPPGGQNGSAKCLKGFELLKGLFCVLICQMCVWGAHQASEGGSCYSSLTQLHSHSLPFVASGGS